MTARDSSFHETFSNVHGKKILGRYGDVDDDFELYLDLFIALTVLEKLEASYSKSLLSMEEYEEELSLAVNQCFKCHALIQSKVRLPFCRILSPQKTLSKGSFCSFPRSRRL